MNLQTKAVVIAGFELRGAKDKNGTRYVVVPDVEKTLGWAKDQTREKLASKSLQSFTINVPRPVKRRTNIGYARGFTNLITTKDFMTLIGWQASNGNKQALILLIACATETLDRRIDFALDDVRTSEETYEAQTRAFYRELARKSFQPDLCSWFQSQHAINYGAEVNLFKRNLKLPLINVDSYSPAQMKTWCVGINAYNALRMEGYGHTKAVRAVGNQAAARLDSL